MFAGLAAQEARRRVQAPEDRLARMAAADALAAVVAALHKLAAQDHRRTDSEITPVHGTPIPPAARRDDE